MEFNWLGVAFVDDNIPNHAMVESILEDKMETLRYKAQAEFDKILDEMGLEQVMGVIVQKGTIK